MAEEGRAAPEFDATGLAKLLLRRTRAGALATLDREAGAPFATLVTVATDLEGSPLLLLSRLAAHTLNLEADGRASILLAEGGKGDPLAHPRLTIAGRAGRTSDPGVRSRFLARHPKARLYADFPDFSFWRLVVTGAHLNGGFARAAALGPADLATDLSGAADLVAAEAGLVEELNRDRAALLGALATGLCGAAPGPWLASGLDPEGLDLIAGDQTARLAFPEPITGAAALRTALDGLAKQAPAR